MPTDTEPLERHRYLSLATFRRDGAEVRTPVWFAALDTKLYVFSAGEAGKVKRLRHSPRARVAPCDARGGVRGDWREATARVVTDRRLIEQARAALRAKYGWRLRVLDALARLTGRLERRAWIEIEKR
jgi:PPOX class probable F420-dependent enzyme